MQSKDAINTRQRDYYRRRPEVAKANARKWCEANPEKRREAYRKYQLKNAERIRDTNRKAMRKGWLPGEHERAEAVKPTASYRCPICRELGGYWVADHHAASGLFREWLCRQCNMALGLLKEQGERLRAALTYLDKHPHGCS